VIGGFISGPHGVDSIIVGTIAARICTMSPECEMDLCQQPAGWFTRN
jgi:hypothetical protein